MTFSNSKIRLALILVDLQNDFVEGGSLSIPRGQDVVEVANRLMPNFDLVVATQDWHPADHQSFASQHVGISPGDSFVLNGLPQTAWPDHCIQQTPGAELVSQLNRRGIHRIIQKGMQRTVDSYSGFFDNDQQHSTGLTELLHDEQIDSVFIMGLATDYCVRFTAIDAVRQGFTTALILDGCRGVDLKPGDCERAMDDMRNAGVRITDSAKILLQRP